MALTLPPLQESVLHALNHCPKGSLPRGELFLARDFLDSWFPECEGDYASQLAHAARSMGLSAIGVDLNTKWSGSLLSEMRYKELGQYFIVGCINGPVSSLIENHGFFNAMLSMKNNPSLFSDIATKLLRDTGKKARSAHVNGFKAIAIADDIAGNNGLLFSFHYFTDVVLPVYKQIAEIIKENGLFTFFHSDGDIMKVIELLIEAGYDCIHPVDTQAGLNLYELKEQFGERLSFMGHVDVMAWNEEQISREIDLAEHSFKKGGLILGSTCGISKETVSDKLRVLYPRWEQRGPHQ